MYVQLGSSEDSRVSPDGLENFGEGELDLDVRCREGGVYCKFQLRKGAFPRETCTCDVEPVVRAEGKDEDQDEVGEEPGKEEKGGSSAQVPDPLRIARDSPSSRFDERVDRIHPRLPVEEDREDGESDEEGDESFSGIPGNEEG